MCLNETVATMNPEIIHVNTALGKFSLHFLIVSRCWQTFEMVFSSVVCKDTMIFHLKYSSLCYSVQTI